jgi:hypothetical protein
LNLISWRACLATALLLACTAVAGHSQTATPLSRQLSRIDFGISGIGEFTKTVSGTVPNNGAYDQNTVVSQSGSNTLGALGTIRYIAKPYVGLEFNYTYARYTEGYTVAPGAIQSGVFESSFGYVVTPPHPIFGLQPFASAGAGSTRFQPTHGGGQEAPVQWRATYYYSVGLQKEFGDSHFGARASFRQAFFLAPDFLQNYLTILQRTNTVEPNFGFYARF